MGVNPLQEVEHRIFALREVDELVVEFLPHVRAAGDRRAHREVVETEVLHAMSRRHAHRHVSTDAAGP